MVGINGQEICLAWPGCFKAPTCGIMGVPYPQQTKMTAGKPGDSELPPPTVASWDRPQKAKKEPQGEDDSSLSDLGKKFLSGTTAHGLSHVVANGSWFRRTLWIVVCVGAFSYFCYQTTTLFTLYYSWPVSVKITMENKYVASFPRRLWEHRRRHGLLVGTI